MDERERLKAIDIVSRILNELEWFNKSTSYFHDYKIYDFINISVQRLEYLKEMSRVEGVERFLNEMPELSRRFKLDIVFPGKKSVISTLRRYVYIMYGSSPFVKLSKIKNQIINACRTFLLTHGIDAR